jgi:hypothetical protein
MGKGKADKAHMGSTAQLTLLAANVTTARAPAQAAVERRQELETQVHKDTATVAALGARLQKEKAAANKASGESIAAQQAAKAHKKDADAAAYAIKASTAYTTFEAAKQVH